MSTIYRSLFFPNHFTVASCQLKRWMAHKPRERDTSNNFLYVIANGPSFPDKNALILKVMQTVQGGASWVQYNDHQSDLPTLLQTSIELQKMLQRIGVPLMVNTRHLIKVAQACNADGVYLEEEFPISEARSALGPRAIIGIPVRTREEVIAAEQTDVDYLSVKIYRS